VNYWQTTGRSLHTFQPQLRLGDDVTRPICGGTLVFSLVCERRLVDDEGAHIILDYHSHPSAAKNLKAVFVPRNFGCWNPVEMNCKLSLKREHDRGV
jgi:hypothetical protein